MEVSKSPLIEVITTGKSYKDRTKTCLTRLSKKKIYIYPKKFSFAEIIRQNFIGKIRRSKRDLLRSISVALLLSPDRAERQGQVSARCAMATRGIYGLGNCRRKNENYLGYTVFYPIRELEAFEYFYSVYQKIARILKQRVNDPGVLDDLCGFRDES
jgi:hypothetical protein